MEDYGYAKCYQNQITFGLASYASIAQIATGDSIGVCACGCGDGLDSKAYRWL